MLNGLVVIELRDKHPQENEIQFHLPRWLNSTCFATDYNPETVNGFDMYMRRIMKPDILRTKRQIAARAKSHKIAVCRFHFNIAYHLSVLLFGICLQACVP
jgi:hypothetical protein